MWDRWRGGDASAVSRRLYTAAGQQTFDEIRRKLPQRSAVPGSAVTRYTQEFERLLAKIGQNDRDGAAIPRDAALGRRQGLHDAGARLGAARLSQTATARAPKAGASAELARS